MLRMGLSEQQVTRPDRNPVDGSLRSRASETLETASLPSTITEEDSGRVDCSVARAPK